MLIPFRIGHGYDVHRLIHNDKRPLMLGGVCIPSEWALEAHSDGDVLLHAVCDALLGAVALGDIGRHFPDTDSQFSGIDSRLLLREVLCKVQSQGFNVGNLDVTVTAQFPKLAPYMETICACLAEDLQVPVDQVNVKATTSEKLGFTGRGEGISVTAVVLIAAS
jgi:2-C-methyl-D-erythritol 2,4-cyclodiphosphate synthase